MSENGASDYLVVGAGAMGMAFTDVLMNETEATVTIVDRHGRPGGHWNDAYPFVRLHQPSSFYGVNSRVLGTNQKDLVGLNAGLYELASGSEVVMYFEQVMNQQFLPTGRVKYLPMCEYIGNGTVRNLVSGFETHCEAKKTVDATYMNVTVPSVTTPSYKVSEGVTCIPPNGLPEIGDTPGGYVVVGGGKTAIDSCLWLLGNGVNPEAIRWIVPRDQWMLDRASIQPGEEFAVQALLRQVETMEIVAESVSVDQMFDELVQRGALLQFDHSVRPTMYRCCTVTVAELDELRRIHNVVRMGRVQTIGIDHIDLDHGQIPTTSDTVHVDCTADGLANRPVRPIFAPGHLTLQTVRTCQQVFSAAFIAHVEAAYDDDETKNDICKVVPHPNDTLDWVRTTMDNALNSIRWNSDPDLKEWLSHARLDGFSRAKRDKVRDPSQKELVERIMEATPVALGKLDQYLKEGRGVGG
ncbi:MAG: NAD(P)-binding protein [Actinomycetota bacterium]|nr:NAD(P)-binding protein [Actinomycetota bacterium]